MKVKHLADNVFELTFDKGELVTIIKYADQDKRSTSEFILWLLIRSLQIMKLLRKGKE